MDVCQNCVRVARTTASTYDELVETRHELKLQGIVILREGRDADFKYFIEWVLPESEAVGSQY